jgi:ketosteroid isomerase-like protein
MSLHEHPNAMMIRQSWQAVSESDVDTLMALWSPDIVWHVGGASPWQGDHVGPESVLEYLAQIGEAGDSYDSTLKSVMADDDYAAVVCGVTAKRGEKLLESDYMLLGRFVKRQLVEVWSLPLDSRRSDAFWARD